MMESTVILTQNNQRLVVADSGDTLTLRVQSLGGHNRGVAKLDGPNAERLHALIDTYLGLTR